MKLKPSFCGLVTLILSVGGLLSLTYPGSIQAGPPTTTPTAISPLTANKQWTPVEQIFDGVTMVLVPPGCFMMGSDTGDRDEKPAHQVCFGVPFWLDRTEVSQAQFRQFKGEAETAPAFKGADRPVESITWFEARRFCALRGARLPTEPEWEYAARGPDSLTYPWGNVFQAQNLIYEGNAGKQTAPVGSKPGGASWVGALDMSGNVWEWVNSSFRPYPYDGKDGREAEALTNKDLFRSFRGGSWQDSDYFERTSHRGANPPTTHFTYLGFRCARSQESTSRAETTAPTPTAIPSGLATATPTLSATLVSTIHMLTIANKDWIVIEQTFDNMKMVYVPAGCFMMGGDSAKDSQARSDEKPPHQVCITRGYWLDAYEVTNTAYQQFIDAGGYTTRDYWSDAGWSWKGSLTAPQDCGSAYNDPQQPHVCVSWYEAEAYAKWRGGRLPTEAEWEYAARGPDALIYPWGNTWDGNKLNADCKLGNPAPVGSYESGKSWVGAYDMAGNVWEWVMDWYSDTYYQQQVKDDPAGPASGQYRVVRGGSWLDFSNHARAAYRPYSQKTSSRRVAARRRTIAVVNDAAQPRPTAHFANARWRRPLDWHGLMKC